MRFRINKLPNMEQISKLEGHIESENGKAYFVVDSAKRRVKV